MAVRTLQRNLSCGICRGAYIRVRKSVSHRPTSTTPRHLNHWCFSVHPITSAIPASSSNPRTFLQARGRRSNQVPDRRFFGIFGPVESNLTVKWPKFAAWSVFPLTEVSGIRIACLNGASTLYLRNARAWSKATYRHLIRLFLFRPCIRFFSRRFSPRNRQFRRVADGFEPATSGTTIRGPGLYR